MDIPSAEAFTHHLNIVIMTLYCNKTFGMVVVAVWWCGDVVFVG